MTNILTRSARDHVGARAIDRRALHERMLKLALLSLSTAGVLLVAMPHAHAQALQSPTQPAAELLALDATAGSPDAAADGTVASQPAQPQPALPLPPAYTEAAGKPVPPAGASAPPGPAVIGEATHALLLLQSQQVSATDRPIPGAEAALSYARYLKSFEHAIPEKYGSSVSGSSKSSSSGSSSSSSSSSQ
ncbi:MAG: DUF3613 domain-containing protein [Comamonas sp.]